MTNNPPTDKKLIHRVSRGDSAAFDTLIGRYTPYVSAIVYNICAARLTKEDMEELCADVFVSAWKNAGAVTLADGSLRPWLGTVARNAAKSRLRGSRLELELQEDQLDLPDKSPEEKLTEAAERALVLAALDSLGETDRDIFIRHYYHCQSVRVIAEALEINENTIKTKLARGRGKLKTYLTNGGQYND
ncbi:MAG: sigma-70 family RNA polymerase sigma factor [Oscillospiraceae bacterium]|jgi:RNA polymerase sigma-70 factor (ECF subfamily)|nr:sigma-70 family RNA polymerase sigma factor [Oscillospiraceae bacterium]